MKKRMLSIFLSAIMVVSLLPVTALAAGTTHEVGSEAELLAAFENAQGGDTILMTADIELDVSTMGKNKQYMISVDKQLTLDGGGFTLSTTEREYDYNDWYDSVNDVYYDPYIFDIADTGSITFDRLVFDSNMLYDAADDTSWFNYLICDNEGPVYFLSGEYCSGSIVERQQNTVEVFGGKFTSYNAAFNAWDELIIHDAEISGYIEVWDGGDVLIENVSVSSVWSSAIRLNGGKTTISGGIFCSEECSDGCIYATGDAELNISGGIFQSNDFGIFIRDFAAPEKYDTASGKYSGALRKSNVDIELSGGLFLVSDTGIGANFIWADYEYYSCPDPDTDWYDWGDLLFAAGSTPFDPYVTFSEEYHDYELSADSMLYAVGAIPTGKHPVVFMDDYSGTYQLSYADNGQMLSTVTGYGRCQTLSQQHSELIVHGWQNIVNNMLIEDMAVTAPLVLHISFADRNDAVLVHSTTELRQALYYKKSNVISMGDPYDASIPDEDYSYVIETTKESTGDPWYDWYRYKGGITFQDCGEMTLFGNGNTLTMAEVEDDYDDDYSRDPMMHIADSNVFIYDLTLDGNLVPSDHPAISFGTFWSASGREPVNLSLENVTIENCVNIAQDAYNTQMSGYFGGAIGAMHSSSTKYIDSDLFTLDRETPATLKVRNCKFCNNEAWYGGAIYMDMYCSFDIADTEICGNKAVVAGGGICCNHPSEYEIDYDPIMENSLSSVEIHGNEALMGGGMFYGGDTLLTEDTDIYNNKAVEGGGLWAANSAQYIDASAGEPYKLHDYSGIRFYGNTAGSDSSKSDSVSCGGSGEGDDVFVFFPSAYNGGQYYNVYSGDMTDHTYHYAPNYAYGAASESVESGKLTGNVNVSVPFPTEPIPDDVKIPFLSWYEDFVSPAATAMTEEHKEELFYDPDYAVPQFNYPFDSSFAPARYSTASGRSISAASGSANAFMLRGEASGYDAADYLADSAKLSSYGMKAIYFGHLVKYMPNHPEDNNGDVQVYDKQAYADGAAVTVKSIGEIGYTNKNKVFAGWNTEPDGSGETPSGSFTITGNTILYAQWKTKSGGGSAPDEYTLYFESNGGTVYAEKSYPAGTVVGLDMIPAKAGFTFTGWYTDNACTKPVTEVTMNRNITVYAGWERTAVPAVFTDDHYAYILGFEDGTVRPEANITRAEVVTIFFRLLSDEVRDANLTTENPFPDVNEEVWYNTAASTLAAMGIVSGCDDGYFHGEYSITRAEFAAIIARFDKAGNTTPASFSDIYGHWAEKEIAIAANNGWILGYEDGSFRPGQGITRAEAIAMINRVLQRMPEKRNDLLDGMVKFVDNADTKWYYIDVQEATNSHDYERRDNGYEHWTALKDNRDWKVFE